MFSKSRINEPGPKTGADGDKPKTPEVPMPRPMGDTPPTAPRPKAPPSVLSSDLTIVGNLRTTGDVQVEGIVEGDIRAHLLTVGESATIKGEIVADDIVVNGRVVGRVRGLKVRLTSSARVEGDIVHKTIAIESGAHFEGSVQRQEDPLSNGAPPKLAPPAPPAPAAKPED
ncbi:bactofilin family protein [Phaeovulum sp.]|jgi:cytoskeletal protein CcmA (bactofilin family)|uniref:bactofilin family protein n=1 Tax=Phaeovulum sp. TaxID=2934796 RepID=UPI0027310FDA|nr:polymer-forming cytoskeletal protein [Phaeovulum sp.]MDP1670065.1 polymer-forming cytoskeletal protein [Phaeovulum sp.]MDZ4118307.1 polymer-forming cytoskeletal protein [Phaeovulum sp.]